MTASGKKLLETKDPIEDVMPYGIWRFPKPVANIVVEYAWDIPLQKPFLFSDIDYTFEKILFLVEYAGPLDAFKFAVTRCIKKELSKGEEKINLIDTIFTIDGMQGTLIQLLVSRLDVSIRNEKGDEIDKGMAESFIDIVAALLPNRLGEVQKQAGLAAPPENKEKKRERESINLAALNQVFDAIKQNDEEITKQAIETFKEFVKNKKSFLRNDKGYLMNNQYYMDLIHLIYVAFDVLSNRAEELPPINADDCGQWYGKKADRFCFEIIGATLQLDLPPRIRQVLKNGIYDILKHHKTAERIIDVDGEIFRGVGSDYVLGVNSYYDDLPDYFYDTPGWRWRGGAVGRGPGVSILFQNLLRAITPEFKICASYLSHLEM